VNGENNRTITATEEKPHFVKKGIEGKKLEGKDSKANITLQTSQKRGQKGGGGGTGVTIECQVLQKASRGGKKGDPFRVALERARKGRGPPVIVSNETKPV